MPRLMHENTPRIWRAVIIWRFAETGEEYTEYLGPYLRRSDAGARVSMNARVVSRSYRTFVRGYVETAPVGEWQTIE